MMLGDSFLFGWHLAAKETISKTLERRLPDYEFYNLGMVGWGLDQMFLSYEKYADLIDPHIIVLTYISDDLPRIYEAFRAGDDMNKPSFSLRANRLVLRGVQSHQHLMQYVINNSIIANKFYVAYKDHDVTKLANALLAELIAKTRERREELIVLRLPLLWDDPDNDSNKSFAKLFAEHNIPYIDMRKHMPLSPKFYGFDGHLSAEGTKNVAEFMTKLDVFTRP
jgi:hypothetical protein